MKKKKLFIILIVSIAALVFATAQVCNQCGILPSQETKEDVSGDTDDTGAATTERDTSAATTAATTSGDPQAPEIVDLDVFMGPEISEESGFCFYRVRVEATGNPEPDIVFSKDDSDNAWGDYVCQVNIEDPSDTYTLIVTATNSEGEDEATLDFAWGCDGAEPEPEPEEQSEEFHPTDIAAVNSAGGVNPGVIIIGDTFFDVDARGLFAFNVSSMADKDVVSATLKLENPTMDGECDFKGDIQIWYVDFLPGGITGSDYFDIPYAGPVSFSWDADPLEFSSDLLKNTIIDRAALPRKLQFGIAYESFDIGGDMGVPEGRQYQADDITLTVNYIE